MKKILLAIIGAGSLVVLSGCENLHSVVTTTQTGLGVSVSENPSTQLYEARLGYFRNEFAFVPGDTNRPGTVPDVLLEIRLENIFKGGLVYQRLAVGRNAVTQPGAALMFAKDPKGNISTNVLGIINRAKEIPALP